MLELRTVAGNVVGYTNRRNLYRVYVPQFERVIVTCDLVIGPHLEADSRGGARVMSAEARITPRGITEYRDTNERNEQHSSNHEPTDEGMDLFHTA